MFFRKAKVQNVSEWLEAATRKIAPPARERIRLEIEAHYAESVATHLAGGLSENDAQMAALAELGNVRHAARRFKRQYLTTWQAQNLEACDKNSKNLFYLGGLYLMFFVTGKGCLSYIGRRTACQSPGGDYLASTATKGPH
jgi:hypothetical protein